MLPRAKQVEIIANKLVETFVSGNYRSVFRGHGIEFDEVREYVAGDDVRLIDWNVTSRMGMPFTKTFREERELVLMLVVDVSSSVYQSPGTVPKHEVESLLFAVLGFSAALNNDRVGALFFTDRIEKWVPPARGRKHVLRLINDLVEIQPKGTGSNLQLALRTVCEALKRRSICFIISDFKTSGYWIELAILSRKNDVVALRVSDPQDTVYPPSGAVELVDPESGESLIAVGTSRSFRKRYHDFWRVQYMSWNARCRRRGVDTVEIGTDDDAGTKLYDFFLRRKKR